MQKFSFIILFVLVYSITLAQADLPAYKLYNSNGQETGFGAMVNDLSQYDVVLFGELHNNPICHWMQYELAVALHREVKTLVIGAEMFQRDDQLLIDEYQSGKLKLKAFEQEAKVWNNFKTDYLPVFEWAQIQEVPYIATNTPRRYASLVSKEGLPALDLLSDEAKKFIVPLPLKVDTKTPGYEEMMGMTMGHGSQMNPMNFVAAQALKDATMAFSIIENLPKKGLFLHFNGDFHSKNMGGIYWYLKQSNPSLKIAVISSEEQLSLMYLEDFANRADYMLLVPESMTKSY